MILYLHFHKCAGTSVISEFVKHFNHIKPHTNGKPIINGNLLDISKFTQTQVNNFCLKNKNMFMAIEFSFFHNSIHIPHDVHLITVIRDPLSRYISNYIHDTDTSRPVSYINQYNSSFNFETFCKLDIILKLKNMNPIKVNYNTCNYYTKLLNGISNLGNINLTEEHLRIAKMRLRQFKTIIIYENKDSFKLLNKYNIKTISHKNKARQQMHTEITDDFIHTFKKLNTYDYQLYNYACKLSDNQLLL